MFLAACLLLLSAGCAKQTAEEPSTVKVQSSTLPSVSGDEAEVTLALDFEDSTTAPAEQTGNGTTMTGDKQPAPSTAGGETAGVSNQSAASSEAATVDSSVTAAGSNSTTGKPSGTTDKSSSTTAGSEKPQQTTVAGSATRGTTEKTTQAASTTKAASAADGGKNKNELPAIPLN